MCLGLEEIERGRIKLRRKDLFEIWKLVGDSIVVMVIGGKW